MKKLLLTISAGIALTLTPMIFNPLPANAEGSWVCFQYNLPTGSWYPGPLVHGYRNSITGETTQGFYYGGC